MELDLAKKMSEWRWERCPGCGRRSKYHPDMDGYGEFHADSCPLEGIYGHTHEWWFERELKALSRKPGGEA